MAPIIIRAAATLIEWELIKGADNDLVLPVLDSADQPVDMAGWTGKAQIRRSAVEPVLHEWTTEGANPNAEIDGTELMLHVVGSVTSTWGWTDAQVSVEVTEPAPSGRVHVIAVGTIRARQEITQ